jgi:hypothetical protein
MAERFAPCTDNKGRNYQQSGKFVVKPLYDCPGTWLYEMLLGRVGSESLIIAHII